MRGYLSLIWKDTLLKYIALYFMWRRGLLLHETHPWKILSILIYVFSWLYFVRFFISFPSINLCPHVCVQFLILFHPAKMRFSQWTLNANNVFVFVGFNVHYNVSLTYSDGTDKLHICSAEAFSWLGNCDQIFWLSFHWLSFRFKRDAPFYCTDGDNSPVNWDNLCDH